MKEGLVLAYGKKTAKKEATEALVSKTAMSFVGSLLKTKEA